LNIRKWLTYITLFVAGLTLAGDLVTVLYYFIDGQELTPGFLLKILSVFVVILVVFLYYISDIRNKLTPMLRKVWLGVSLVIILGSIVWGFAVLGSPRTQQLLKYDQQKVSDLQNINYSVQGYYQQKNMLPVLISDLMATGGYLPNDQQTGKPYEYIKTGNITYLLCAVFNKDSVQQKGGGYDTSPMYVGDTSFSAHPSGHYCFPETISANQNNNYPKVIPAL
jgi:hypothetical protein